VKLSIIIPVYNESSSIGLLLEKIFHLDIVDNLTEVIVVNDGSTDATLIKIKPFEDRIILINHENNKGKGAALRTGFERSCGDIILVQDADLEYHPEDYDKLLMPFNNSDVDVVLGIRKLISKPSEYLFSPYFYGGRLINFLFNVLSPVKIADIHAGYKVARRSIWEQLELKEVGFNFCHEFLIKSVLINARIVEVPITYTPRTRKDGKKIKAIDGGIAIKTILKLFWDNKIKARLQ
jgi:glycosyltransferase involved in cell wall biosynthesis